MKTGVATILPSEAISISLKAYDSEPYAKDGKKLLHNWPIKFDPDQYFPKQYQRGELIDITLGELLSLGVVGCYYNKTEKRISGDSYSLIVGLEDSAKKIYGESLLSDGAILSHRTKAFMPFQQVAVQGYYPKKRLSTDDLTTTIQSKIERRITYPEKCGLIVSIYSDLGGELDFLAVIKKLQLDRYDIVLCLVYDMVDLEECVVMRLDKEFSEQEFLVNAKRVNMRSYT